MKYKRLLGFFKNYELKYVLLSISKKYSYEDILLVV